MRGIRELPLILLFDIQTGVAGDMILGALFDLGLNFPAWKLQMETLGLPSMHLEIAKVSKQGISATKFTAHFPHEHAHRGLADIRALIERSPLSPSVKANALKVFTRLAQVEAKIHGVPVEAIHFHEVGALDAIVDIVGACLGFEMLAIDGFFTTPFTFGTGSVMTQHGRMSVPVPATLALSEDFPSRRTDLPGELCTPTGTALVSAFARPLSKDWTGLQCGQGYGAGTRDLPEMANVLRLCLLQNVSEAPAYDLHQVECNLDNMAPELIGYAVERLFAVGCKDVWQEAIVMKKNRSAVKLCALAETSILDSVLAVVASETATGGVRFFPVKRLVAEKSAATVATPYGQVDLKGVKFPGMAAPRYTPEYESCRSLALAGRIPLPDVYREAVLAAARLGSQG